MFTASGGGAVPIRDGARRPSEGNVEEIHLRGDATVQAAERGCVSAAAQHRPGGEASSACKLHEHYLSVLSYSMVDRWYRPPHIYRLTITLSKMTSFERLS